MARVSREQADETKEKLIRAAIRLFAQHGFAGASLQMVADLVGVSQGAPLHHFKSKNGLLEACVESIINRHHNIYLQDVQKDDDAYIRLVKYFRAMFGWASLSKSEAQVYLLLFYSASQEQNFAAIYNRYRDQSLETLEHHLLSGKRENLFHFTLESSELAQSLYDFMIGHMVNQLASQYTSQKHQKLNQKIEDYIRIQVSYRKL